jgi:hypothetical protein
VSSEGPCVITGILPINIKIEETARYYECIKGNGNLTGLIQRTLSKLLKDKKTVNTPFMYTQTAARANTE